MNKKRALQLTIGTGLTLGMMSTVAGPIHAAALTSSGSTVAHVAVNPVITLSGLTSNFTLTGNPLTTAAANGAVTMNVVTNNVTGYTVTVQAAALNLVGGIGGNTDVIPVTALSARETGATPFTALSNTAALTVHSQAGRSIQAGDVVSNDFSVAIPFVASDTYSGTLNYIAATQ